MDSQTGISMHIWSECGVASRCCRTFGIPLAQGFYGVLPEVVVAPGQVVSKILPDVSERTGIPSDCVVCGGTTGQFFAGVEAPSSLTRNNRVFAWFAVIGISCGPAACPVTC